ncbi:rhomboid family intramembrane serine protease [Nonomuraea aurantiaca]|uniref:rhomboid family intramembrane serine protease n=1 Tax=Nonomuraea aurantiaca TaxID=2878562 RepID=UPI001CD9770F|nr:rhomboid family intramembrane serine protease [Nonomuraea aurantiaca]MCA2229844.1 rhomboid family intramembrane serine protease [Nonomuraea aurantiaca]
MIGAPRMIREEQMEGKSGPTAEIMIAEARKALWVMVGFLAVIWTIQVFNWASAYDLSKEFGLQAWDPETLPGIVTSPFLHWSWEHIEANSGPLFIFGFLSAYRGVSKFISVTAFIILVSGLGAWFTASPTGIGVGASGVVFGYFGYVLVRGAFDRHLIDIVIGLVMALCFAYQFMGLLPEEGVGWQAHGFGFLAGLVGGWVFRDRRLRREKLQEPAKPGEPAPSSRAALLKELDDLGL